MHIVLVNREFPPSKRLGGIGAYHNVLAYALIEYGHKVTIICASDDTREEKSYNENGINIIRLSGGDFCIKGAEPNCRLKKYIRPFSRYFSYRKKVLKVINSLENIDIIEFAEYGNEAYYIRKYLFHNVAWIIRLHGPTLFDRATLHRKKLKFSIKSLYEYITGLMEYKTVKQADSVTACSAYMSNWFSKDADYKKCINVIYNFIDLNTWSFLNEKEKIVDVKKNKEYTIFFSGTIVPEKGVTELIEACKELYHNDIKVKLILAGKIGDFGERMRMQNLTYDFISFLGHIEHSELKKYYMSADIVCIPSWWENLPMVCIEAMASGALVLGSNAGGMNEIIEDGKDGFLIAPKNPSLLSQKIKMILSLPNNKKNIIKEYAVQKIRKTFSKEKIVKQLISYYSEQVKIKGNQ